MRSVAIVGAGQTDHARRRNGRQPGRAGARSGRAGARRRRADDGRHRQRRRVHRARAVRGRQPAGEVAGRCHRGAVQAGRPGHQRRRHRARGRARRRSTRSSGGARRPGARRRLRQALRGRTAVLDLHALRPVLGPRVRRRDHGLLRRVLAGPHGHAGAQRGGCRAGGGEEPHATRCSTPTRTSRRRSPSRTCWRRAPLCWPIKLLDVPPISDGACAVVLGQRGRRETIDARSRPGSAGCRTTARRRTSRTAR